MSETLRENNTQNNKNSNFEKYRKGVGVMLVNKDKKVFIGKRKQTENLIFKQQWQMPQGGTENNEDPKTAAIRELTEETGVKNITIIDKTKEWITYDLPPHLVPFFWNGRFVGQKQKWFLARFDGNDDEINLQTADQEFTDWRWCKVGELIELVVDFKKEMYKKLLKEFGWYFENA
jgi:putative (di)nucleoside polyphosphate hydrolase